jgi:AraC-like DNA-binding protein
VYLARKHIGGKTLFTIRESYRNAGGYLSRDLFELGAEPAKFIVYPGGNAFYIDAVVEDGIRALGSEPAPEDMEDLFWPFLNPYIRRKLEPFRRQERQSRDRRRRSEPEEDIDAHIFDRRRIHFLKTGQVDPRALGRVPASLLRPLRNKSRDEIEQGFMEMESILRPREYKTYTYAIFNLQEFFRQRFAKNSPELLDADEVDACFIEELCRLQRDPAFWAGMEAGDRLSDYLVRYAVMYFDHEYAARSLAEEFLREFINRHRHYRPPPSVAVRMEEIAAIFGKSREALKKMSRRDLGRLYRRKAQELHPDKGGDHERFVKLNEAYHRLLRAKH